MTEIDYKTVVQIADNAGLDRRAVRPAYSGRSMYGKECLGITGDMSDFGKFAIALSEHERDEEEYGEGVDWTAYEIVGDVVSDNMGHRVIFYFPRVQVTDVPAHTDDDDDDLD